MLAPLRFVTAAEGAYSKGGHAKETYPMAAGSVIEGTSLRVLPSEFPEPAIDSPKPPPVAAAAEAVLAGGCFWCTEAVYRQLDGVLDVVPGYAGGTQDTADYETVCTGR